MTDPMTVKAGDKLRVTGLPEGKEWTSPTGDRNLANGDIITVHKDLCWPVDSHEKQKTAYMHYILFNIGDNSVMWGYIFGDWVEPIGSVSPKVCTCNIMVTGCTCGVFAVEQEAKRA